MGNTEFFAEAIKDNSSISWKDIFSESFAKHTKADMEYAMQRGTLARQVPEENMLETWDRPWLWWPLTKWGVGLIAVLYGVFLFLAGAVGAVSNSFGNMMMIIPPLVIPLVIMILFWELNIPQNISLTDLLVFFVAAGVINFAANSLMFTIVPGSHASWAALREEPAKMIATILILLYIQNKQKKKIYGLTGLLVGATVGAAFSGIESVSYAINFSESPIGMIGVQLLRSVLAPGGHFAYCISYSTAMALKAENGRITVKSILDPMTLSALAISMGCHALWNAGYGMEVQILLLTVGIFIMLFWIRKALRQIVLICGPKKHTPCRIGLSGRLTVCCNTTSLQGTSWVTNGEMMVIGRQRDRCNLCFDNGTPGVSRQHCKIFRTPDGWCIQDLNSAYGTYLNGKRLTAFEVYPICPGNQLHLGSKQVWLTIR